MPCWKTPSGCAEVLQGQGQDATFFRDEDGLYKVRFGNFTTLEAARLQAESLRDAGVLTVYALVPPEATRADDTGEGLIRERIVRTAQGFLGLPYRWGGASAATGFDCSGLTMTAYRLNGFDLPRTSAAQFRSGSPVRRGALAKGDLVFFSFSGKGGSTHVGLYIGNRRFIHAPGEGRIIRVDDLSAPAFRGAFIGARSYL